MPINYGHYENRIDIFIKITPIKKKIKRLQPMSIIACLNDYARYL